MALIRCPECGREVSDKAVACPNCGMPVSEMMVKPKYCHSCGAPLAIGALFCTECGTKVTPASDVPLPQPPHKATPQMPTPPSPVKPQETPIAPKVTQQTPPPRPASPVSPVPPVSPVSPAAPITEPVAAPEEKVEIPHTIKPKSAPSLGLSEKAGRRRAEALARKEVYSNDGKHIPEKPISAPAGVNGHNDKKPEDKVDMPEMVTPKAAPSIPTAKNTPGSPAHHNIRKPAEKPQPPTKTITTPEPTPKPAPEPDSKPTPQKTETNAETKTVPANDSVNDSADDSQYFEDYDDSTQPFEQQLAYNKEKQKKNIIMASVLIFTIAVVGICIWVFASVKDEPTVTEVVDVSHTKAPAPEWLQGEWLCQGSAYIDNKHTPVNSSMTIKGDSVLISDYKGKPFEGQCHIEGSDLVCTNANGNVIRLTVSEQNKTIEYAGGLSYKRGLPSEAATAEPANQNPSADVNATGNTSKAAPVNSSKPKTRKAKSTTHKKPKSKPASSNSYSSKKRSSSMPEY